MIARRREFLLAGAALGIGASAGRTLLAADPAKSNEDVAEFLKRLNSSVFFSDVNLDSTSQVSGRTVKFVNFGLSANVVY